MKILPALVLAATISAFIYEKPVISPLSSTTRVVWATTRGVGSPQPTPTTKVTKPNAPAMEAPIEQSVRDNGESTSRTDAIIQEIQKVWGPEGHGEVAKAIATSYAESSFNQYAVNYNCRYEGKSTTCKTEDEHKAWQTDCGYFQIGVPGNVCPKDLFDTHENVKRAYKLYKQRGWSPWVAAKKLGFYEK